MRIMGIDYGDSRIGIAVSDRMGWLAQGLETINCAKNPAGSIDRIIQLVKEYNIEKIVVGLPKNMNGTIGQRGEKTLEFINLLEKRLDMKVVKWDERLTTVAANRTMHETGVRTAKKKAIIDQIAAMYILQGYLDSLSNLP